VFPLETRFTDRQGHLAWPAGEFLVHLKTVFSKEANTSADQRDARIAHPGNTPLVLVVASTLSIALMAHIVIFMIPAHGNFLEAMSRGETLAEALMETTSSGFTVPG
jgi:hypothetical protein